MAFKVIRNADTTQSSVVEIVADTLADMEDENFPTKDDVGVGSDCICLENSSVHMLGNDGIWHEI